MDDTALQRQQAHGSAAPHRVQRRDLPARALACGIATLLIAMLLAAAVANPGPAAIACLLAALVSAICAIGCIEPLLRQRRPT